MPCHVNHWWSCTAWLGQTVPFFFDRETHDLSHDWGHHESYGLSELLFPFQIYRFGRLPDRCWGYVSIRRKCMEFVAFCQRERSILFAAWQSSSIACLIQQWKRQSILTVMRCTTNSPDFTISSPREVAMTKTPPAKGPLERTQWFLASTKPLLAMTKCLPAQKVQPRAKLRIIYNASSQSQWVGSRQVTSTICLYT